MLSKPINFFPFKEMNSRTRHLKSTLTSQETRVHDITYIFQNKKKNQTNSTSSWLVNESDWLVCTWHVNMAVVTWIPRALCIQWNFESFNGRRSFRKRPYFHLKISKTLFNGKRPSKFLSHRKYLVCGPSHTYVFLHIGLNLRLLAKAFYAFKDQMGLDGNVE